MTTKKLVLGFGVLALLVPLTAMTLETPRDASLRIIMRTVAGCSNCVYAEASSSIKDQRLECCEGGGGLAGAIVVLEYSETHGTCNDTGDCVPTSNCRLDVDLEVQIDDSCHDEAWICHPGVEEPQRIISDVGDIHVEGTATCVHAHDSNKESGSTDELKVWCEKVQDCETSNPAPIGHYKIRFTCQHCTHT